jgi:hypothetical protein
MLRNFLFFLYLKRPDTGVNKAALSGRPDIRCIPSCCSYFGNELHYKLDLIYFATGPALLTTSDVTRSGADLRLTLIWSDVPVTSLYLGPNRSIQAFTRSSNWSLVKYLNCFDYSLRASSGRCTLFPTGPSLCPISMDWIYLTTNQICVADLGYYDHCKKI